MADIETVEKYEKAFLGLSAVMLALFLGALGYAAVGLGIHLPSRAGELDPTRVSSTPPFDDPGVHRVGPDEYEVVVIGQAWAFQPREIEVPAGAEVTFIATSRDVIHGMNLEGTTINVMLIPGQVTRVTHTFEDPGQHFMICHEYCGAGHHNMYGTVTVTAPGGDGGPAGDGEDAEASSGENGNREAS